VENPALNLASSFTGRLDESTRGTLGKTRPVADR